MGGGSVWDVVSVVSLLLVCVARSIQWNWFVILSFFSSRVTSLNNSSL